MQTFTAFLFLAFLVETITQYAKPLWSKEQTPTPLTPPTDRITLVANEAEMLEKCSQP